MKNLQSFKEFLNEGLGMNDPVIVAIRAAKMDRAKTIAKQKEAMKKRVYGKQREKLEDELWDISQDLKDLYSDKRNLLNDMESEAGEKGDEWSDSDANRYGDELNDIDAKIEKLLIRRQELEIKLTY